MPGLKDILAMTYSKNNLYYQRMKYGSRRFIAATVPMIASLVAVFVVYTSIGLFFLLFFAVLLAEIVLLTPEVRQAKTLKARLTIILPFLLLCVGSFGTAIAVNLSREKMALLENPDHVTSCSISPIVACSPVIGSDQASAFDIPNPFIGIFGFGALVVAGMSLLAGGVFAKWWWRSLWLGIVAGFGFCVWLIWQSLYVIGSLCLYCNAIWAMVIPAWIYVTLHGLQNGYLPTSKKFLRAFESYHLAIVFLFYAVVLLMVYFKFQDYWQSLL